MAPTKRKTEAKPSSENVQTTTRVTRSSTRQETPKPAVVAEPVVPKAKKAKATPKAKPETKEEEEPAVVVTSSKAENGAVPKAKKAKATPKVKPDSKEEEPAAVTSSKAENGSANKKTVVVEHCKQCTQFKIRGEKVKKELEKAVAGITVLINPEKPRRGCFEIREEGGKTFISLLDMKRPFAPMKALNMDAVISDIIEQVK